jgi:Protein kinase domain
MANKLRNKSSDSKIIKDAIKSSKIMFNEFNLGRRGSKAFLSSVKQTSFSQINSIPAPGSLGPKPDIIESLLAKHILISKKSRSLKLKTCPKNFSNSKNETKVYTNDNKHKEYVKANTLIGCLAAPKKKETSYVGDYELLDEIGKGTYGVVKLANHTQTNEKFAIKIYEKTLLLHPNRKKNVEREIKILSKLKHPNIIKLITTIETAHTINLVFEYVSGCSLLDYIKNRSSKKIKEIEAKSIFKQIIQALEFCHSIGVSHRDIKLENVLLDEKHNVKLIDFGFSTFISSEKKVQLFCGTLNYMAPEILANQESLGAPTDIWAAGVLLFVLITGTFPFKAFSTKELYSKIQKKVYNVPPTISSEAKELFNKIFENDPHKRPTAGDILVSAWTNSEEKKVYRI